MDQGHIEHVRTRVVDLRYRLQDIEALLYVAALASNGEIESVDDELGIAVRAMHTVSVDLASICNEQSGT